MNKKRLPDILIPNDYQHFYAIVQVMTEEWLSRLTGLKMNCDLASSLVLHRYPPPVPEAAAILADKIANQSVFFAGMTETLRQIVWLHRLSDERLPAEEWEYLLRERWKPYDEDAWDDLFEQVVDTLKPVMAGWQQVRGHILAVLAMLPGQPLHAQLQTCLDRGDKLARNLDDLLNPVFVKAQRIWQD